MGRAAGQILLGALLLFTGTAHLTFARTEFQAQVPAWIPVDENLVVLASGVVELLFGSLRGVVSGQPPGWAGRAGCWSGQGRPGSGVARPRWSAGKQGAVQNSYGRWAEVAGRQPGGAGRRVAAYGEIDGAGPKG
jgi:hypothetical protein